MQVTETLNEGLKRGYTMLLTGDELASKVDEKIEAARADFQMKGFRKGKAPMSLMKKMFGKSVIGEAMQEAVDDAMKSHFDESGDRPALRPDIKITTENWEEGDDLNVEMSYEKMPDVPEADYASIQLERMTVEVEDDAVNEALGNLAASATVFEARDEGAAAEDGDQVVIDFTGRVDGEVFEGGTAEDYPLVLGSNSFIPGFEPQLVGKKSGETCDVTVSFPDDYNAEALAGKEAVFECVIKEVKAPEPAPVDDDLAVKFGAENLEDLRKQLEDRLSAEYKDAARTVLKRQLLDQLDEIVQFDLPDSLVEAEASNIAHQLWHEDNPDVTGHDHPDIETTEEHQTLAKRRVRLGLLLADIGNRTEITVSDNETNQAIMRQAMQYRGQEKQFFDFVKGNEQMLQNIRAPIYEDKVVDYVLELAKVSEKPVTKTELEEAIKSLED